MEDGPLQELPTDSPGGPCGKDSGVGTSMDQSVSRAKVRGVSTASRVASRDSMPHTISTSSWDSHTHTHTHTYMQRDIPMPLVTSGVEHGNLRELALARMRDLGTEVSHSVYLAWIT